MDVLRFIAEVKARPALWDIQTVEYRDRTNVPQLWQQVADIVGFDVEKCKRKWKNLRDAFRAEIRRTQRRAEKYKDLDEDDPRRYRLSKWIYFEPMSFIFSSRRPRRKFLLDDYLSSLTRNSSDDGGASNGATEHDAQSHNAADDNLHTEYDIKSEPANTTDDDMDEEYFRAGDDDCLDAEDDDENEMLFEEFRTVATPQAMRQLTNSINVAAAQAAATSQTQTQSQSSLYRTTTSTTTAARPEYCTTSQTNSLKSLLSSTVQPVSSATTATSNSVSANCKCTTRVDEQVHFLQDLEREEEKLIKSTHQDISRCDTMSHVGDSDYNFLISFLPLMKKMSEIQNVHFRAKMSELLLHTMTTGPPAAIPLPFSATPSQLMYTPATPQQTLQQQLVPVNGAAATANNSNQQQLTMEPEQVNDANNDNNGPNQVSTSSNNFN